MDDYLDYLAYCDTRYETNPVWKITNTSSSLYKENPKYIKFISIPTPMTYIGQKVYIPNKLWYITDTIIEIEPEFKDNKFNKFLYRIGKESQLAMSIDFFTSKSEAIKRAWINQIKSL